MPVINTNIKALMANASLQANERPLSVAMERLSTGKRINSSRDDAAGMAIASWMNAEIRSLNQAVRNAGDAVSLLQTADGATSEISNMLQRMREISVLSVNDTYNGVQRGFMDMEFQQLKKQIVQIANNTEWNGFPILNGTTGVPIGHQSKATGIGTFATSAAGLTAITATDMSINGLAIGIPSASDDTLSYWVAGSDNRAFSAIARAAAINAKTPTTGVRAIAQPTLLTGTAMSAGTAVYSGTLTLNGKSTTITTVINDASSTRDQIVRAINALTPDTGVVAKDTGQDVNGILLTAMDGRNIEVTLASTDVDFATHTGLKAGIQTGAIALTTQRDDALTITSPSGYISRWGLSTGDFSAPTTRAMVLQRSVSSPNSTYTPLNAGDLMINGFAIRATADSDDTASVDKSGLNSIDSSDKRSSAIALAMAINDSQTQTQVTALAQGPLLQGVAMSMANGTTTLMINNSTVSVTLSATQTAAQRLTAVLTAVNAGTDTHGVEASLNDLGGIDLTTADGRNLSIQIGLGSGMTNADLGLNADIPSSSVSTPGYKTYYGSVTLQSREPFTMAPGANGYSSSSNFKALGFLEGHYGFESTGQLSFQVGARRYQTINIDMPDFGSQGGITGLITADAQLSNPIVGIATPEAATKTIELLDRVMQKVNESRATMGAVTNRLNHAMDNITNVSMNTSNSRSKIEDTDYSLASSELARAQIIQQAATAVLAQANASQQIVLKLLQQ
jgi:flagellin